MGRTVRLGAFLDASGAHVLMFEAKARPVSRVCPQRAEYYAGESSRSYEHERVSRMPIMGRV